ncbi:MAG: hypothetical protein ACXWWS_11065 [Candidatus Deferrimicrobiaceae bacterium]
MGGNEPANYNHGQGVPEEMLGKYRESIVGSALIALMGVVVVFF